MRYSQFLSFEWKQFKRSSSFQKGIGIKIVLLLAALYFIAAFTGLGLVAYYLIQKSFPQLDPIVVVNNYLIFWFLLDLTYRFFLQQLPVMNIKPFMLVPVKRSTIIHYLLAKTSWSFFNWLPLFFFIPFAIILIVEAYPLIQVMGWLVAMILFTLSLNYLNFLINKNNTYFYGLVSLIFGFAALRYFNIYDITVLAGEFFNKMYSLWYAFLIPLLLLVLLYRRNYAFVRKSFYLDDAIRKEKKLVRTQEFSFLNRFGKMAPFLKNDLKLILRNARPKQVLFMSFLFLFYGLIFYTQETYSDSPAFLVFASVFITGGFLLSYGQLVPSWDSEYYKLLMSQNIPYRQYLESKWYLMLVAVIISFILATPYIYFGWDIYAMIAAGAIFNIGLNSFITLFGGALNRVPVELNVKAKAFGNTQGFNPTQLLIALPKMLGPMLIFYIPYKLINFNAGLLALALSGLIGLMLKSFFLNKIESIYQKGKYKTIAAFNEKK